MLAPVVGYLSAALPTRTKSLTVDGLDVLRNRTGAGNTYGVPIGSIDLTEAGPGQVSSLAFSIDDPAREVWVQPRALVHFMDLARDVPLFAGFVERTRVSRLGVGRRIDVECTGAEVLLDWCQVPALTFTGPGDLAAAVQGLVAQAYMAGGPSLNVAAGASCTLATPVGVTGTYINTFSVAAGSLRQGLETIAGVYLADINAVAVAITVDFRFGLRMAEKGTPATWNVADYADPISISTPADGVYEADGSGVAGSVAIAGGNAAGSGVIGSGLPGQVVTVTDTNSLTTLYRNRLADSRLTVPAISGTVVDDDGQNIGSVGAERRAGCRLVFTDPALPAAVATVATSIAKTFTPDGKERWAIRYGTSSLASQYLRRLSPGAKT